MAGRIPCYDVEELISAVLPSVSEALFKQIKESVYRQGDIKARFGDTRPSEGCAAEDVAFLPLNTLFADVATAVSEDGTHESLVVMESRPNQSSNGDTLHPMRPDAQNRVKHSRAAGMMHHPKKTEPLFNASWYDIIMTYEYKTKKNDIYFWDNAKKVLWSMSLTLSVDLTRLCTLGLTIEDTTARLWYCDRSSWAVGTPFDIFEEPECLLRIFIGLNIASVEELGYDSSMQRVSIDGAEQFHITVTSHDKSHPRRTYQTVGWITNNNADYVVGRGTRVWRVKELDANTGELGEVDYALKDSWVEANRVLEGEWYQVLYDASKDDPDRMKQTEEHFLQVRAHGVVNTADDKQQTTLTQRRNRCTEHANVLKPYPDMDFLATSMLSVSISNTPSIPTPWIPFLGRKFQNRFHYRIVLIGIGSPLDRCTQWSEVWTAIIGACTALSLMQQANLVHRDVSPANILFFGNAVKLIDLDFAGYFNQTTDSAVHEDLTGTLYYMSGEVAAGRYQFMRAWPSHVRMRYDLAPSFRHNFLHDAESLWWIVLFYFAGTEPVAPGVKYESQTEARSKQVASWFPRHIEGRSNPNFNPVTAPQLLNPAVVKQPDAYKPVHRIIIDWLDLLTEKFEGFWIKRDGSCNESVLVDVHHVFRNYLVSVEEQVRPLGQFDSTWRQPRKIPAS